MGNESLSESLSLTPERVRREAGKVVEVVEAASGELILPSPDIWPLPRDAAESEL